MVSLATLDRIKRRLQQIFRGRNGLFGGCSILLFGDFWQLPPIGDKALFTNIYSAPAQAVPDEQTVDAQVDEDPEPEPVPQPNVHVNRALAEGVSIETHSGFNKYRAFNQSVELRVQQRQQADQASFAEALEGLRNSKVTLAHWETLSARCQANVSLAELKSFDDAIRLYPTNSLVDYFNHKCQRDGKQPIIKVLATHDRNDTVAAAATTAQAGHLEKELDLCIGCKLMILENMWTERGIVNGTQCRLYDIVWSPNCTEPRREAPLCLLVAVPKETYGGPYIEEYTWRSTHYAVVPIFRSKRDFWLKGETRYRTQFPVKLAYALTIHKAQGMTMSKAVVNITQGIKNVCLFYVAASRVKRIEDLLFEEPFDFGRLSTAITPPAIMRHEDWDRRALQRLIGENLATTQELTQWRATQEQQQQQGPSRRRRLRDEEEDLYGSSQAPNARRRRLADH